MIHTDASRADPEVDSFLVFFAGSIVCHPKRLHAVDAETVEGATRSLAGLDLVAPLSRCASDHLECGSCYKKEHSG